LQRQLAIKAYSADEQEKKSLPNWHRPEKRLCIGTVLVKQFKVPAVAQELILDAFEERGWPQKIDDPLPVSTSSNVKRRLHDAIKRLNQQSSKKIQFSGNGNGNGVCWRLFSSN